MRCTLNRILKKIPTDFSTVFTFDLFAKVFGALIAVLLIRILTPEQYATYTKFNSLSSLINGTLGTGLSLSFVRYLTESMSRGDRSNYGLYTTCIAGLISAYAVLILGIRLISIIYDTTTEVTVLGCTFGVVLAMLHINQSFFHASEKYSIAGVCGNGRYLITFIVLLTLYLSQKALQLNTVLQTIIGCSFAMYLFGGVLICKQVSVHTLFQRSKHLKDMLHGSAWLILYCVLLNLMNQMDVVMLTHMASDQVVAEYGVAYKYYGLCLSMLPAIMTIMRVRSSKKEFVDSAVMRQQFTRKWIKKSCLPILLVCGLLISVSGWILPLLNGDAYAASVGTFRLFCIGIGASYLFAANVQMMMSAKKYKILCLLSLIAFAMNCGLNYLLIPRWSASGAAVATVLSNAFINVLSTIIILHSDKQRSRDSESIGS